MNIRIATAFLLGLATMALASLSCSAEEPAPTATPAPQGSAPEAHAQDLSQACAKATASPYFDLVRTVTNKPSDGEAFERSEAKLQVAGADYHWTLQSHDGNENEGIYVGGVNYRRDGSSPWVEQ